MDFSSRYDHLLSRFTDADFPPLIITIGLGDGDLLDAVARRSPTAKVLALEPIALPAVPAGWQPWIASGRLTLLVGPDFDGRADAWRLIERKALKPPMLVTPSLEERYPAETAAAKTVAKQVVLGAQSNEDARRRFSGPYLLNTIANMPVIAAEGDAAALTGLFAGVPGIVVGAGPSLDRNLPVLDRLKGRVVIIAVDTAVRPLLAAGIHPTFVVGVDPGEANARHLRDLPATEDMWFVSEGSLPPDVFAPFAGRTFIYKVSNHHPWPWLNAHGLDCGTLQAWGSVITTAFDLACRIGCDPVIFAGADLAYTDGLPYCRNTIYEPEWRQWETAAARAEVFRTHLESQGTITLADVAGRDVLTAPRFVQFRDWIVARAGKEAGGRVINATGGGILHGGRIVQKQMGALELPVTGLGAAEMQARLQRAWAAARDRRERSTAASAAIVAKNHETIAAWLMECGETAPAEQIVERMAGARQRLSELASRLGGTAA